MATYSVLEMLNLIRHEGTKSDIVLTMDSVINMTDKGVTFVARDSSDNLVLSKTLGDGITVDGQTISIQLDPGDTIGKSGNHKFEVDILDSLGDPILAINGFLVIRKQVAPNEL